MLAAWALFLSAQTAFVERDGQVSMEAENATAARGWAKVEGKSGAAMQDGGGGHLTFSIQFARPGKYYVWMLCRDQGNTETNDCFVTLDGQRAFAADDKTRPDGIRSKGKEFAWVCQPKGPGGHTPDALKSKPVYVAVPAPGWHTFKIGSRSKGFVVDKVVLVLDNAKTPEGTGPEETVPPKR